MGGCDKHIGFSSSAGQWSRQRPQRVICDVLSISERKFKKISRIIQSKIKHKEESSTIKQSIKGTVSLISSHPSFKDGNSRFKIVYPWLIHKDTLKTFIWSIMWKLLLFSGLMYLILIHLIFFSCISESYRVSTIKDNQFHELPSGEPSTAQVTKSCSAVFGLGLLSYDRTNKQTNRDCSYIYKDKP